MQQLIPGYTLTVLSGTVDHFDPYQDWHFEPLNHEQPRNGPALARYNTTDPDFFRVGQTVFMIRPRQADEV